MEWSFTDEIQWSLLKNDVHTSNLEYKFLKTFIFLYFKTTHHPRRFFHSLIQPSFLSYSQQPLFTGHILFKASVIISKL